MKRASVPRRALIVSAGIGEGHNSAGRALEEAVARVWPGCQVDWLDALATLGPGSGALARAFYLTQVQRTPRMYEFFFAAMWRHRWYLEATRRGMGWWFGWRMQAAVEAFDPDVIISTCAHPSWLYRNLDITYVMHPCAVDVAVKAEPGMRVAVGALPVRDAFAPGGQATARERLGIGSGRLSCWCVPGQWAWAGWAGR
jgi:hypothetical protein